MPLLSDAPLLDVALHREGLKRRWTITRWSMGWSFRYIDHEGVTYSGCANLDAMRAQKADWEAEIAVAKADGWK